MQVFLDRQFSRIGPEEQAPLHLRQHGLLKLATPFVAQKIAHALGRNPFQRMPGRCFIQSHRGVPVTMGVVRLLIMGRVRRIRIKHGIPRVAPSVLPRQATAHLAALVLLLIGQEI